MQPKTIISKGDSINPPKKYNKKDYDKMMNDKYKALIYEWKSQGCKKCGESRPHLIDAHHIDPTTKKFSLGHSPQGKEATKKELAKCIALCSNCHRHFHFLERETGIGVMDFVYSDK